MSVCNIKIPGVQSLPRMRLFLLLFSLCSWFEFLPFFFNPITCGPDTHNYHTSMMNLVPCDRCIAMGVLIFYTLNTLHMSSVR